MNVVICGMKHCGKTTHGRLLARHWKCEFVDTDDLLVALYRQRHGLDLSPRDIFQKHGDELFRRLEADAIAQIGRVPNTGRRVFALGGGAVSNPHLDCKGLKQLGMVVYLKLPSPVIFERIVRNGIPPMLQGESPYGKFIALYNEREPRYITCADLIVELDGKETVPAAGTKIIAQIEEYLHERQHLR